MSEEKCIPVWKVEGLVELLHECGIPIGHPWFDRISEECTHFCGMVHGVDSVRELIDQGLNAKLMKALRGGDLANFPKMKYKKMREVLMQMRHENILEKKNNKWVDPAGARPKRGRKSKYAGDAEIEWITVENPHKQGSDRWCMWEVTYGSKNRDEFLLCDGMCNPMKNPQTFAVPNSGYFCELMSSGHIVFS